MQCGSFAKITSAIVAAILIATIAWLRNHQGATKPTDRPASEASQVGARYDLSRDEHFGGHTLERHVAQSDEQLLQRLAQEREISAASTYTDRAAAEQTVAAALAQEHSRVESWLNRSDSHPNLALHFHGRNPIGRSIRRGEQFPQPCYEAAVVLRWDGERSFHVLTTYPEPARGR